MNKRFGTLVSALVFGVLAVAEVGIAATQPRNIAPGPCIIRRGCQVAPKPCGSNPASPRCGSGTGAGTGTGTGGGRGGRGSGSGIPGPFTGR